MIDSPSDLDSNSEVEENPNGLRVKNILEIRRQVASAAFQRGSFPFYLMLEKMAKEDQLQVNIYIYIYICVCVCVPLHVSLCVGDDIDVVLSLNFVCSISHT